MFKKKNKPKKSHTPQQQQKPTPRTSGINPLLEEIYL